MEESELLKVCPWCGYSLVGLPVEHRCPECGQPIDRRWQVFRGRKTEPENRHLWEWDNLIYLGFCLFVILLPFAVQMRYRNSLSNFFICFSLLFPLLAIYINRQRRCRAGFIAVCQDHIAIGNRKTQAFEKYSWNEIKHANRQLGGGVVIKLNSSRIFFEAATKREGTYCVEMIRDWMDELEWQTANEIERLADQMNLTKKVEEE